MYTAKNFSFNGQPIEFILNVPFLVLVDPIILKYVNVYIDTIKSSEPSEIAMKLKEYSGFRVGVNEINKFRPGTYKFSASCLHTCDSNELSKNICEVDSAYIMVVGIDKLGIVSKVFTWERFDTALRSPIGDDSKFIEFVDELGGPFFGVITPNQGTDFKGDGRYKLREGAIILLDSWTEMNS